MEFDFSDFTSVVQVLRQKNIVFEEQENPNHKWLSIMANGHEFKLNNRLLSDIVDAEIADGKAVVLK